MFVPVMYCVLSCHRERRAQCTYQHILPFISYQKQYPFKCFVSDPQNWKLLGARHVLNDGWERCCRQSANVVDKIEGCTGHWFIDHMAAVSAYCCSSTQYLKEAVRMKQMLGLSFFFTGIKQVVALGHLTGD
jgi:hypothetical protein